MADAQGGDQQQHYFIDQLESDTSLLRQDLASVIANRQEWERFQCGCTRK